MSKTLQMESVLQFAHLLDSSRVVVADFYADWCGPCKSIAPFYEQLSAQLSRPNQITFVKINVDSQRELVQTYNITAMPTFVIFKNSRETQRIQNADPKALNAAVNNLAAEASSSDASGSGAGQSSWLGAGLPRGYGDVTSQVDQRGLDFLNMSSQAGTARSIFDDTKPGQADKKDWIESDTDEQLMLYVPFQSSLKIHSLFLTALAPEDDDDIMRPKTVKVYTNRSNVLGFDEAESMEATQTFELDESSYDSKTGTAKLELRFVKFQNVTSIVIFVVDGLGDGEKTRLDRIRLIGETGEKRAMGKLEKIGDEAGE